MHQLPEKRTGADIRCVVCRTQFRNNKLLVMHMRLVHRKKARATSAEQFRVRSGDDPNATTPATSTAPSSFGSGGEAAGVADSAGLHVVTESFLELARSRAGSSDSAKAPQSSGKPRRSGPVACQYCQILFWNDEDLLGHQDLCGQRYCPEGEGEEGAMTHVCQVCQLVFPEAAMLAEHERTCCSEQAMSTISSPSACPVCHLPFVDPSLLSAHMWVCGKARGSGKTSRSATPKTEPGVSGTSSSGCSSSAVMIMSSSGGGGSSSSSSITSSNSNYCDDCGKVFQSRTSLVDHINSMHKGMQFSCPDCGEKFKWRTCVYRHKMRCRGAKSTL